MERLARAGAAVAASFGAYCALGAVAIAPGSTTATRIAALPPAWVFLALLVAWTLLLSLSRASAVRVAPLYGTLACVLPFLPGRLPAALLAWQGVPAAFVWLAAVVACLAVSPVVPPARWQRARRALTSPLPATCLAALLTALAVGAAWQRAYWWVPGGDEPHYLVITQSLLRDGDLQIENNHERGDYGEYFSGVLKPDFLQRGTNGRIYSIHAPGLPAAVLPAFAVAGYPGVVIFLIACSALGAALTWRLAWRVTGHAGAAWFGWAAAVLSWPVLAQGFSVYPDGFSAWLVIVGLWAVLEAPAGAPWRLACGGAALAALPWMHTRMAILPLVLGTAVLLRCRDRADRGRALLAFASVPAVSALAWFAFFHAIYGTWSPLAPYGNGGAQSELGRIATGLPGLLFDQQFGLLPTAPAFLAAIIGVCVAVRRDGPDTGSRWVVLSWALATGMYALAVAAYPMWFGGASSPARFLVPVLPAAAVPLATAWASARHPATRATLMALLLATLALAAYAFGAGDGQLAITQRAPFSPLLQWATRAADVPAAVPSVLRGDVGLAMSQAAIWLLALALGWVLLRNSSAYRLPPAAYRYCNPTALESLSSIRRERSQADGQPLSRFADSVGATCAWAVPVGVLVVSVALSANWRLVDGTGLRPSESRGALLRAAWPGAPGVAFLPRRGWVGGVRTGDVDRLLPGMPLETSDRDPGGGTVRDLPAGRYRVEAAGIPAGSEVRVAAGSRRPLARAALPSPGVGVEATRVEFDVPVPLAGLAMDVAPPGPTTSLQLVALAIRSSLAQAGERARTATRYGPVTAFVLSDRPFVEPDGVWLRPGSAAFVLQSENGSGSIRALLRNPPVENTVEVRTSDWHRTVTLGPGAESLIEIPIPQGQRAVRVEFTVANGVRPADLDRASTDTRRLGAWLGFPE